MQPLDGPDLFHLAQERPGRPMHTLKIAILERAVDCAEIDRWAQETLFTIEPLRRRLAYPPVGRPVWVSDGRLERSYHVQHVETAAPGGEQQLADVLSALCSGELDRTRPLWRIWHVTRLAGGRDALVLQLHHVVGDGNASVSLWEAMAAGPAAAPTSAPAPSARAVAAKALADGTRDVARLPSQLRRFFAYLRQLHALEKAGEPTAPRPFSGPATRFNVDPDSRRRCVFVTLPLPRLKAVARAADATMNEVFLTICSRAVHRHLARLGEAPAGGLTGTVPAALPERREVYGNSVTTLYVALHSDIDDPLQRLRAIRGSLNANRRATERDPRLLPDWQRFSRMNRGLISLMERTERRGGRPAFNLIVSSVRGPQPFSLAGVPVVELRSIGPLAARLGLNITGWSYGDDFSVGIHTYESAAERIDELGELLLLELDELEAATRTSAATRGAEQ